MLSLKIHNEDKEIIEPLKKLMEGNYSSLARAKAGEECHRDSLGWLAVEEWANETALKRIEELAEKIRADAEVFVLIGVGGSNNAARSVIEALKTEDAPEIIYAGNTLSPHALNKMMTAIKGKSVYINCIAKNFETLEPGVTFRQLRQYLYQVYGGEAPRRVIATGTNGSSLAELCGDNGYTFLEFPENVGGRYTAMTNVGLLPMAVAGIDIRALVKGAKEMEGRVRGDDEDENIAYQYACLRNLLYRRGYRIEMLASFEPQLRWFYKWWIQLFAESEGKEEKGIFPVVSEYSEELHAVGQFVQDGSPILFETFLDIREANASLVVAADELKDNFDYLDGKDFWDINKAAYQATLTAHREKLPCITLTIDKLDAYHFGQLFYFFQFACYLSCDIMGVNPFNQPGVEAYKGWMFKALGK